MNTLLTSTLHIGFDDTDSLEGNCTTYLASKIIRQIASRVEFQDYPRLIRNNPNIPWKTRGNGAIALTIKVRSDLIQKIILECKKIIEKDSHKNPETNPGIIFITDIIPSRIEEFSKRALTEVIEIKETKDILDEMNVQYSFLGNGRGLIGALAAIGNKLEPKEEDFTFEILTYRTAINIGSKRKIDEDSVLRMDKQLAPNVFNNVDEETNKVLICPAGLDPVFYGIRGENPEVLLKAMNLVKGKEEIESYCIFRTNQGTDQHFRYSSAEIKDYKVFNGEINVIENPKTLFGGHVIFKGRIIKNFQEVDIAAFEPSKNFRKIIRELRRGDRILAMGGIKYNQERETYTIQLEKCEIKELSNQFKEESPFCPNCNKRMVSNGKNKGYKCRRCKFKDSTLKKKRILIKRTIKTGIYIPPAQAQRHLVKPYRRYNLPKKNKFEIIKNWFSE